MRKIIKYILERIYHYSSALHCWSWNKLYKNRKEGYGYEEEKKMTQGQKKVKKVMKEFKKGTLKIGGSDKKVKNRKQAIAIALNRAGISKNRRKNGKRG